MANRQLQQFTGTLLKRVVKLYVTVKYTSSGNVVALQKWNYQTKALAAAPTATGISPYQTGEAGIKSVARTGTGAWTVVLQDSYQRLLGVNFLGTVAASGVSTIVAMGTNTTGTDVTSNTAPTIKLVLSSATATAADPADGDYINFELILADASEP